MRGDGVPWRRRWAAGVVGARAVPVTVRAVTVRGLAAGALAVGVFALGGCTGGAEPEPSASGSVSPTPTASPSPSETPVVAPVRPPEMERSDEVGAVAAAEYFMELFAYVMATGDLVEWDAVSYPSCEFCAGVRGDVVRVYGAGGRFDGLTITTAGSEVLGYDDVLNGYGVGVTFALPAGVERDAAGDIVDDRAGESGVAVLDVAPSERGWRLVGLSLLAGEP